MKAQTRRRIHLILAWAYWALLPPGLHLMIFHEGFWLRIVGFVLVVISVETASSTHIAAAAADTPMNDEKDEG